MVPKPSRALLQKLSEGAEPAGLSRSAREALRSLFEQLVEESHERRLKDEVWLVLAASSIVGAHVPAAFDPLWTYCRRLANDDTHILFLHASLLRETILKCIATVGIPGVLAAMSSLMTCIRDATPAVVTLLSTQPARRKMTPANLVHILQRGEGLWHSEHRPHDHLLTSKLAGLHPDLPYIVIHNNYGALLSDPVDARSPGYAAPLGRLGSSFSAVAVLRAAGGQGPQLAGHAFGILKVGEEAAEGHIDAATEVGDGWHWLCSSLGCVWILDVADRVVEALKVSEPNRFVSAKL